MEENSLVFMPPHMGYGDQRADGLLVGVSDREEMSIMQLAEPLQRLAEQERPADSVW